MTEPAKSTPAKAAAKPTEVVVTQTPAEEWKIQLSKKVNGDLWNVRARSGEEFRDLTRSMAEYAEDALEFLADFVQVALARGVQTDSFNSGGGAASTQAAASNSGPPSCKHGEMKDLASKGYRHRYYCSARNRNDQCPPQD